MDILQWIDDHKEEMLEDLKTLIEIDSVEGTPQEGAPFGTGPRDALLAFLAIGDRDGFTTDNVDNYAGEIEMGEGEETIGILAHVDVVPAGSGWETNPFELVRDGEYLQGRGTQDDKGPGIAAYYAMRALKECNVPIKRKLRMILGTNEETNWGGINYYKEKREMPDFGFTPDAHFPVIFGEKGITTGKLRIPFDWKSSKVLSVKGGNAPNMVADGCTLELEKGILEMEALDALRKEGIDVTVEQDHVILFAKGKSAHGSTPEAGVNAISIMMEQIAKYLGEDPFASFVDFYNEKIGFFMHGEGLGVDYEDPISGKLNFNVGMIQTTDEGITLVLNMRFPLEGVDAEMIKKQIEKSSQDVGGEFIIQGGETPLFIDPESTLVRLLMEAYQEQTKDYDAKPITIGGGTYAKAMKNCVGYGAMFQHTEDRMHQKNERIPLSELMDAAKIYALALKKLATEEKVI
ncbi:MAG: dipeptidase PepV [Tissierellia bacterium]|nr:dipeptidase PepV [Tissierellia bacterium]